MTGCLECLKLLVRFATDEEVDSGDTCDDSASSFLYVTAMLDVADRRGQTAAHLAAHNGHLHVLKYLHEQGADLMGVGLSSEAPLQAAEAAACSKQVNAKWREQCMACADFLLGLEDDNQ